MKYLVNIFSNIVKISAAFIFFVLITKYNSVEGVGQLGQLLTFSGATLMVATLGIQNKLIQDISLSTKCIDINYFTSLFFLSVIFLLLVLAVGKLFFFDISLIYGATSNLIFVVFISFIFVVAVFMNFKIAVYSGMENYKKLASINIYGSLLAVFTTYVFLDIFEGIKYQFYLIMLYPCFRVFFVFFPRNDIFQFSNYRQQNLNKKIILKHLKSMLPFIVMAIGAALIVHGYQYSVRNLIASMVDWSYVGQWQILQKHSEVSTLFYSSLAAVFIIPKLAKLKYAEQLKISKQFASLFFGMGLLASIIIHQLGSIYIFKVFGSEYKVAGELLATQLIGDILKIVAYCYCLNLICNSWVKLYLTLEAIQYLLLYISYYICFSYFDKSHMSISYTIAYSIFLFTVISLCISLKKGIGFGRLLEVGRNP